MNAVHELLSRLRAHDVRLWVEDGRLVYDAPTDALSEADIDSLVSHKASLLALLGPTTATLPVLTARPATPTSPLSYAQERLWLVEQLNPVGATYHAWSAVRLHGPLDVPALSRALAALVQRHASLRTRLVLQDGQACQQIDDGAAISLTVLSREAVSVGEGEDLLAAFARQATQAPFALSEDPLFRASVLHVSAQEHGLVLILHHLIGDGWSLGVLVRELAALYAGECAGEPTVLPPLELQYTDYAQWQREAYEQGAQAASLDYWRHQLAGAPSALALPTDHARPPLPCHRGGSQPLRLTPSLSRALEQLAREEGVTLFMLLLAAYQVVLSRWSGQDEVVVGTPVAGRTHRQTEGLVGFFVNTLALRGRVSEAASFRELLAQVKETALGAYAHQELPFEKLVQALAPVRDLSRQPVFQVMLALQNLAPTTVQLAGVRSQALAVAHGTAAFDLTWIVEVGEDGLSGALEYAADLFEASSMARLAEHLVQVLAQVVAQPGVSLSDLTLTTAAERHLLLETWNATAAAYPRERCLHELFAARAAQAPEAIAASDGTGTLSYGELERRSNQLAHYLRQRGVGPEVVVGLCVPRSLSMLVGMLGILKAGGAYLPIDPSTPTERVRFMCEDAGAVCLLTAAELEAASASIAAQSTEALRSGVQASNAAYVIYTSGSTGQPKGVLVPHRGAVNLATAQQALFGIGATDRVLQFARLSFDASVWEWLMALSAGAQLCLADVEDAAGTLARVLVEQAVTVATLPPSVLGLLEDVALPQLHTLVVAGESCQAERARQFSTGRRFINAYGPTEASVCATAAPYRGGEGSVPIGRPIANVQVYVLDARLRLAPIGVVGELYIAGEGLARGYLKRPSLTAQRFIANPYGTAGSRLYRTGDLVRYRADGELEFLGRVDHQVKLRGYRIEPGEIEAQLLAQPSVQAAAVLARVVNGDERLVAYVVPSAGTRMDTAILGEQLASTLPAYMVPASWVVLERLPQTANGKLDRAALPLPAQDAGAARYVAPRSESERTLAQIWSQVLKVPQLGIEDDFFELGGHSLLATQVISRVREAFALELPLRWLFEARTIAKFAVMLERAQGGQPGLSQPALTARAREAALPASYEQERLWFVEQVGLAGSAYHMDVALRLSGPLDAAVLERSLAELVRRHESLRTHFESVDGQLRQVVAPAGLFTLQRLDAETMQRHDGESLLEAFARQEAQRPFELSHGPLFRASLLAVGEQEHGLVLGMHHIISDGWSNEVLLRELGALYAAYGRGETSPLAEPELQYADYALWQRDWLQGEVLERQLAYWKAQLAGAPPALELPTDHARPAVPSYRGAIHRLAVPAELSAELGQLARQEGVTLFMLLLAAYQVVLSRWSGQDEVVVGTPVAGRTHRQTEGLVGFFVNTLALRGRVSEAASFRELLAQMKEMALGAYAHQELPFEKLVQALAPARDLSRQPVFQAMLVWQNVTRLPLRLGEMALESIPSPGTTAKFDLTLTFEERADGLHGEFEYATDLFEHATIERFAAHYLRVLEQIVAQPETAPDRFELLDQAECRQLLHDWNAVPPANTRDACVHELFEAQAARTPSALALSWGERQLSYAELNRRANRLAHYLRERGATPDCRIALCVERGIEMIVALLGILKAGAGYVPLDPAYPQVRLAYMVRDSAPLLLLTQASARPVLAGLDDNLLIVDLDADAAQWQACSEENPQRRETGVAPHHLAYVIYTSGSTGQPKGVMVEHANVVRLFDAIEPWFGFGSANVWTLFHSYAFDFSVWEIWGALLYGGRLVVVPHAVTRSPEDFYALLCREGVSVLSQTPSAFRQLIAMQPASELQHALRYVVFGGEALEVAALKPWYERNAAHMPQLINMYGITETTVHVSYRPLLPADARPGLKGSPIGVRIPDLRLYVLDRHGRPTPIGLVGEIYVGGAGVTRGYLNRPDLTAERFLDDPFSAEPAARMYKTGDLARYLANGELEFFGRNDHQIKIRGFRIELGEIEAQLAGCPGVREAAVIMREDEPGDKRLVAYLVLEEPNDTAAASLRGRLAEALPEHMVPSAFVVLESLPLTTNFKLDRERLPAPGREAYAGRQYAAPQGEIEQALAAIWQELLGVERVGRHDNFFELGGHSLLAMTLIDRMRRRELQADVRTLFTAPSLAALAAEVGRRSQQARAVPPNLLDAATRRITPELLPLVALEQEQIEQIVAQVDGGAANIQDVYPLAALQRGFLFHHVMSREGDAYLLSSLFAFDSRERLDAFLLALQAVIDRHDILRTAVLWESLPEPVQVVWRQARLKVEMLELGATEADAAAALQRHFNPRCKRLDVRQAPLMRGFAARDRMDGRWLLQLCHHHLIDDNTTLKLLLAEVRDLMAEPSSPLAEPLPFRDFIARARMGVGEAEHERFFSDMLGDIDEPTAPFGLLDIQGDGNGVEQASLELERSLARRIREQARSLGISTASLCHLAYAQVLAAATGRQDVVFGTVLFGRMQAGEGAERAFGVFINTLPIRLSIDSRPTRAALRDAHMRLAQLLRHEHASLAQAQRCSGVQAPTPLFSALLNYRHNVTVEGEAGVMHGWPGVSLLAGETRTNFPLMLAVDDLGEDFRLTAQVAAPIEAMRWCLFMQQALAGLVDALEASTEPALRAIDVLPAAERQRQVVDWNATARAYPREQCIHELIAAQAQRTPTAAALIGADETLSYAAMEQQSNRLAQHLRRLGVGPEVVVGLCVPRSPAMMVGLLAILKAGGAYLPLDPSLPAERLGFMLEDAEAAAVLTVAALTARLPTSYAGAVLRLDADAAAWAEAAPEAPASGVGPQHLAYVIYTSGSTGQPKGVMVRHQGLVNYVSYAASTFEADAGVGAPINLPLSFDGTITALYPPLIAGTALWLIPDGGREIDGLVTLFEQTQSHALMKITPSFLAALQDVLPAERMAKAVHTLVIGGQALAWKDIERWRRHAPQTRIYNHYGPTETVVGCIVHPVDAADAGSGNIPIGRPIANAQVYVLDEGHRVVPVGVVGELYIGGDGVARGYLKRPSLTAQRFIAHPYGAAGSRLYRTGDLVRWRADGELEFLGRIDHQVKVRGFRIELGEIEARLVAHASVHEAAVIAREVDGDERLVAYVIAAKGATVEVSALRAHLAESLPDYMVPSAYVVLEQLPLTRNGKLDRRALPAPDVASVQTRAYEPPQGELEQALAGIWQGLLGLPQVGRYDHFFELGGHSLLAMQLVARLRREFQVEVPVSLLFEKPQLCALAEAVLVRQAERLLGDELGTMRDELTSLSEDELRKILAEDAIDSQSPDQPVVEEN